MQRNIRFRAKPLHAEDAMNRGYAMADGWVYGGGVVQMAKMTLMVSTDKADRLYVVEIRPETVGQFTGLNDRHMIRIYEGDYLETKIGDTYAGGYMEWIDKPGAWTVFAPLDRYEITGNIHDKVAMGVA